MLKLDRFDVLGFSRKDFLPAFILLLNAFTWYGMTFLMIEKFQNAFNLTSSEVLMIEVIYSASVIGSSIIGSFSPKIQRLSFLYVWMILGTVSSLLPIVLNTTPYVWSFALGFSLGLGMPVCLAYFANSSTVENRGRMSGITLLAIYLSAALLDTAFRLFDFTLGFALLAIWRIGGLLLFIVFKPKESIITERKKHVVFREVLKDKSLRLYIIPWIMFIAIDRLGKPVLGSYLRDPSLRLAFIMGPIIGSFSAFFGGFLSDKIGRKRVVIGGFASLGLAYAIIGIAPNLVISWYFYAAVEGIAWGILMVTFLLTIWGDLSQFGGREKYYVLGGTPFYFTSILESLFASYLMQIPAYAVFSLASFFLFIAVLPLLYAPETLPEKKIELIRLKGYIEQAKKIREKYK